ncbi:MAG: OsmC family protein [Betaproteobacteria bacterium]|jgi:uncharacterized OsmC-like protein|nr:OsmC family protein [Betaproteobacteria bacterium]
MNRQAETITSSGYPLGFRVARGERPSQVLGGGTGEVTMRVEARTLGGHQKEALVSEGEGGDAWRLVSDEGPNLKGTDLAPFPLAFFNAALHADLLQRARALGRAHDATFDALSAELDNYYTFTGSFFKGTGKGTADPVTARLAAKSAASPERVTRVLDAALAASPVHAAFATPLVNVFALYVNGRRCPVKRVAAARSADAVDPFLAHGKAPAPLAGDEAGEPIITRLDPDPNDERPKLIAPEGFVPILIRGASEVVDSAGVVAATALPASPGARFRLLADARPAPRRAPTPLALAAAGVAFCYMTQLSRYVEHRKHKVHGIRVVQLNRFGVSGRAEDFSLRGSVAPFETHVFLNADEPDELMQTLLEIAENTCYLHAALRSALPGRVEVALNGHALSV